MISLEPRLSLGGKGEPGTQCLHMCQNPQKSWEFRFFRKISRILLSVLYCYSPHLLVSTIMKTCGINYFCLGKILEPVGSRNFERQEQDLAIGDLVGLCKSSSLFEVLDDYFLASLFH